MPRPASRTQDMPIDGFFRSLAEDQANKAIGVIHSGTGSDGAPGLRAIKADEGITIVQEQATGKYPENIAADADEDRLRRFSTATENGPSSRRPMRDM